MKLAQVLILVSSAVSGSAAAQGNLGGPLPPQRVPVGNPITLAKVRLGQALFWDEQLSSTRSMACGSCHIPEAGGSDPRTVLRFSMHPGSDGVFGTEDDIAGSAGVPASLEDGRYTGIQNFGSRPQVTERRAPSMINAGYVEQLFWDGRADSAFLDPESGQVLLPMDAALESQALAPLLSSVEMAHNGRDLEQLVARIEASKPLALAEDLPGPLEAWIGERSYAELFEEAFGSGEVKARDVAFALASYERSLTSDQTPLRAFQAGNRAALTPAEERGLQVFRDMNCASCHGGPRLTNDDFRYTGVRPAAEDLGRFVVSGLNRDRGSMKVPSLLNLELRAPYFHNGGMRTIAEVVDFYDRGGDFSAPNLAPQIQPLNLTPQERGDLILFLGRPLTDGRVRDGRPPFDRPTLFGEGEHVPQHFGAGTPAPDGRLPRLIALEPPKLGNPNMTLGIERARAGVAAVLLLSSRADVAGSSQLGVVLHLAPSADFTRYLTPLNQRGVGSVSLAVPDELALVGRSRFAQWLVLGATEPRVLAATDAVELIAY